MRNLYIENGTIPFPGELMLKNRRVLLCGHSLFISSVRACLEAEPGLALQQVDPRPDHIREQITTWQPDVLILETNLLQSTTSISLLHDFPKLKLIGLDNEDNRMVVFSGSASNMMASKDLLQSIES